MTIPTTSIKGVIKGEIKGDDTGVCIKARVTVHITVSGVQNPVFYTKYILVKTLNSLIQNV